MEFVKKSIDKSALHKREYDRWVNERQMQTIKEKVNMCKALDPSLVDTKSIRIKLKEQDTNSKSGNDAHADDADIRPIYDEEPMVEVQTTVEINVSAIGKKHTEQPEFNNEGGVDQNADQCGNRRVKFSRQLVLGGFLLERYSHLAQPRLTVNLHMVQMRISLTHMNAKKLLMSVQGFKELKSDKHAMTSDHNSSKLGIHDHRNEPPSSKLVPKVVPLAEKTATS
nr:hypothetical protein [Tanacetum cinerariifolium]